MKKFFIILAIILVSGLLIAGCTKDKRYIPSPKAKSYSITTLQAYDQSLCTSRATIREGYEGIGIKLQPYDSNSKQPIQKAFGDISFLGRGGGSANSIEFSCYITDPTFPFTVSINAKGYLPVKELLIDPVPVGKMYLIKAPMEKKPACYYDEENLEGYYNRIQGGFDLNRDEYTLECMDSNFGRGGFVESKGKYNQGGNFELSFKWGWCSSGGTDCGWKKCFAVEGNNELFQNVKNKLCNEISSKRYHDGSICTSPASDDTAEVKQKCLDGAYEYKMGNKKIISIIQTTNRCLSIVDKGGSDCLGIY